jgi:HAD superfamily hydrolase (TIGR01509 family)
MIMQRPDNHAMPTDTLLRLPPFDALIFDADGTLVDTESTTIDALYDLSLAHGLQMPREEAYRVFRGQRMADCIAQVQSRINSPLPEDFMGLIRQEMAKRFDQGVQTMPGALELARALSAQSRIPYCVATNGPRMKVTQTLSLSGLMAFFEGRVFCAYEVGSFKPEPALFLHAANAMRVSAPDCAVVEDSEPGVRAGLAAGMQVLYVGATEMLPSALLSCVTHVPHLSLILQALEGQSAPC